MDPARIGVWGASLGGYLTALALGRNSDVFAAGEQAHVPLLAGWNSAEGGARGVLGQNEATPEGYAKAIRGVFGDRADEALKLYPGTTNDEVQQSATDLAGDRTLQRVIVCRAERTQHLQRAPITQAAERLFCVGRPQAGPRP